MKKHLLLFFFQLIILNGYAQTTFQKIFTNVIGGTAGCEGYSVQQTKDGGYIISGTSKMLSWLDDVLLIKTDSEGDTTWTRNFQLTGYETGYSVKQTKDGGYIIGGSAQSFPAAYSDLFLIKTDANGNLTWSKTYGGADDDYGYEVEQTFDGGYAIAGNTWSYGTNNNDMYVIKTNSAGAIVWTRTYGGVDYEYANGIAQTADSGYIITGQSGNFGAGGGDIYLVKTKPNGDTSWVRTYGGTNYDEGKVVKQTSDGGYIIAGFSLSFGAGYYDAYLVKTDSSGTVIWSKIYGGSDYESINSIQQTTDGGYVFTGTYAKSSSSAPDLYVVRTDAAGDTLWTKTYGGIKDEYGYGVQQTQDGGFVMTGITQSFTSDSGDVYLVKTGVNGISGCNDNSVSMSVKSVATIVGKTITTVINGGTAASPNAIVSTSAGETSLCLKVGVDVISSRDGLMIYPNPVESKFTVYGLQFAAGATFEIYNVLGEKVFTQYSSLNTQYFNIDVSSFKPGIYILKVTDGEKEVVSKFVKA